MLPHYGVEEFESLYRVIYGHSPRPLNNPIGIAPPPPPEFAAFLNPLKRFPPPRPPPLPPPAVAANNVALVFPGAAIARAAPRNTRQLAPAASNGEAAVAVKGPKRRRKRGPDTKTWVPLCYRESKRDAYYYATDASRFHLR